MSGADWGDFPKILAPVVHGYPADTALNAARAIGGAAAVVLVGLIRVEAEQSLSTAASAAQELRNFMHFQVEDGQVGVHLGVHVAHRLWDDLLAVAREVEPDLILLDWAYCAGQPLEALRQAIHHLGCDLAVVRGPLPAAPENILVALRGGPYAELALRIGLNLTRQDPAAHLTAIHLTPGPAALGQDAPFRGLARVLDNLPEVTRLEAESAQPVETIQALASGYDLLILGARASSEDRPGVFGPAAERLLAESACPVLLVRTCRSVSQAELDERAGQTAISVLVDKWFAENTYRAAEFSQIEHLLDLKRRQNLTISLALPALNEEKTVGNVIRTIKSALMDACPLLDEIVLIDSNSSDATRQIAADLGIPVYIHQEILPEWGERRGKGEALWKSLYVTRGDIVLWIDTDVSNIRPHFVYGLIGPLLADPHIQFVKGFYRRPIKVGERMVAGGGGRVTELTARPLLNLFYPELSGVIQPLSGEYGGRRAVLEQIPFFSGYGVEIGLLIEIFTRFGLHSIAQVDLLERIHHNQPIESLSKMSFAIIQAVMAKLECRFGQSFLETVNRTMKLIRYDDERLYLEVEEIAEMERMPMIDIPEYLQRRRV